MATLAEKLKKNSKVAASALLTNSIFYAEKDITPTPVPMVNVALSGSIDGGLTSGLTILAGPSKHFKTSFGLMIVSAYMKKHPDAMLLFYDNEFGSPQSYFESFGIDTDRVFHTPFKSIEELKFDIMGQLEGLERKDKVIIMIDSIGNAASKKEIDDALSESSKADMTRAKQLKSLFRMITPYLTMLNIPMLAVNHTYKTQEIYSRDVVSGGCMEKGTKVIMSDGALKRIEDIAKDEFVMTLDGPRKVLHTWNPETLEDGNPECIEVEFEDGTKVVCSEDHPFLVDGTMIPINEIAVGTLVTSL